MRERKLIDFLIDSFFCVEGEKKEEKRRKRIPKKQKKKIRRELVDAAQSSLITLASFK